MASASLGGSLLEMQNFRLHPDLLNYDLYLNCMRVKVWKHSSTILDLQPGVLKLESASESRGGCVQAQIVGLWSQRWGPKVRPEHRQAPRWCCCCWPEGCILRTTGQNSDSQLWLCAKIAWVVFRNYQGLGPISWWLVLDEAQSFAWKFLVILIGIRDQ